MDLKKLIRTEEIEQELNYTRNNQPVKAYPKKDCTISTADEIDQLKSISGSYYFYGQIQAEILKELGITKSELKKTKALIYFKEHKDLQNTKQRITDKMLEHIVNSNSGVCKLQETISELESAETKLAVILTALKLKQENLIEIGRRNNKLLKSINNLT